MSKERGRITPVAEEAYSLRDIMSKITGVSYNIRESLPDFPPPADHASWYLLGSEFRGPRGTAHAQILWEDKNGRVFIQSMYVGNTTEWIGPIYGEEGAIAAMKIDYSDFNRARNTLAERFPAVEKRLREYESILADISSKRQVSLNLRRAGERGVVTFFVVAKIEPRNLTADKKAEILRLNADALKEAWNKIIQYNRGAER